MSEPRALRNMEPDDRQLLKEAVCDAILERTRRLVSGDGEVGRTIVGAKPSQVLSSGFILPRLNESGDDESSDIRLASHGLDLRIREVKGRVRVVPALSVYVRVFPSSDDLFARGGRLIPRAELSQDAARRAKAEITRRLEGLAAGLSGRTRRNMRANVAAAVYREMGVGVPTGAIIPQGVEAAGDALQTTQPLNDNVPPRLRIPNAVARRYEAPLKWRRVDVPIQPLELPLPAEAGAWQQLAANYSQYLQVAIRDACTAFLLSEEGRDWSWRRRRPQSEDFWTRDAWEGYLLRVRTDPPVAADVLPQLHMQLLVQALPDPTTRGCQSVRVALENLRESDADLECGLFNVAIQLELPEASLAPMRLERVRRSYHLAGFMTMPAIGVNGGVEDLGSNAGMRTLRTTWMPRYVLPRMKAREIPAVPTAYSQLCNPKLDLDALSSLVGAMDVDFHPEVTQAGP